MGENQFSLASWCQIEKVSWLEIGGDVHFFSVLELGLAWTCAGPVCAAAVPESPASSSVLLCLEDSVSLVSPIPSGSDNLSASSFT